MAKDKLRNTSASIRQRLLNHSTAVKTDPNLVLIWYGLERFLYRLSKSAHSERFVLKGAMPKSLGVEAPPDLGIVMIKFSNSSCRQRLLPQPSSLSSSTGMFKMGGSRLDDIH